MRNVFLFLPLLIILASCKTANINSDNTTSLYDSTQPLTKVRDYYADKSINPIEPKEVTIDNPAKPQFSFNVADEIVALAKEYLGVKYKYGGNSNSGIDCSGLVYSTFMKKDFTVPRTALGLSQEGILITKIQAIPGDLIFFKTNGRKAINHVGIITDTSNNDIKFIHASFRGGVVESSLSESYYNKAFVQINRILF